MNVISAATGTWYEKSTWMGMIVPGPGDSIEIKADNIVTIPARDSVTLNASGSITVDPDTQLTVAGTLTNNGGAITLSSAIVIEAGGAVVNSGPISGPSPIQNSGHLTNNPDGTLTGLSNAGVATNNGTITVTAGTLDNAGTLNNGGTITLSGAGILNNSGSCTNTGTINLNGVSVTFAGAFAGGNFEAPLIQGALANTGPLIQGMGSTIALGSGTQALVAAGGHYFPIAPGASLVIGASATLTIDEAASLTSAGTISVASGQSPNAGITLNGMLANYGTLTLAGGSLATYLLNIGPNGVLNNAGTLNLDNLYEVVFGGDWTGGGAGAPEIYDAIRSQGKLVQTPVETGGTINVGQGTQIFFGGDETECHFMVPEYASFVVGAGASLTIVSGSSLDNYGTFTNSTGSEMTFWSGTGFPNPHHAVLPAGFIKNTGEIRNYGTFNNGQVPSEFPTVPETLQPSINNSGPSAGAGGSIENESGATFNNYGSINNSNGSIENAGSSPGESVATFNNYGPIDNSNGSIGNDGTLKSASGNISGAGQVGGSNPIQP